MGLPTLASQVTPYSRGVASRWPRLAENTMAALSAEGGACAPGVVDLDSGYLPSGTGRRIAG